jgi:hypothetical protein
MNREEERGDGSTQSQPIYTRSPKDLQCTTSVHASGNSLDPNDTVGYHQGESLPSQLIEMQRDSVVSFSVGALQETSHQGPPRHWNLHWTDRCFNRQEFRDGTYWRYVFFSEEPEEPESPIIIRRQDVEVGDQANILLAPRHYANLLAELFHVARNAHSRYLTLVQSSSERTPERLGLETWLRYVDDCRDRIFNEIQELFHPPKPDPALRLPSMDEWAIKQRYDLHAIHPSSYSPQQLQYFDEEGIPITSGGVPQDVFDCRPGTSKRYDAPPPMEPDEVLVNIYEDGLGGSRWKKETKRSFTKQYHRGNSAPPTDSSPFWKNEEDIRLINARTTEDIISPMDDYVNWDGPASNT